MAMTLLEMTTIIVAGMMVGNELCVSIINASLRKLEDKTRFDVVRPLGKVFGDIMPFWYAATFLLTALIAFRVREMGVAALLADTAAVLWLLSIVYSIVCLVPINTQITQQEWETRPSNWAEEHQKWDTAHHARVGLLVIALACLILACLPVGLRR